MLVQRAVDRAVAADEEGSLLEDLPPLD